jgi:hypothetical protein
MRKGWVVLIFAMLALSPLSGLANEVVSIEGEVNDNYQLAVGNGQVYEIADTPQGNELAEVHIGEKVKVTGTIEKNGDYQVIVVTSYQTLAE